MPLRRYFLSIGGVLLTLLFLIDWYLPQPAIETAQAAVDRSTIRIHSTHKWPTAVVFDTTQPIIVPSAQPVLAEVPAAKPAAAERRMRDALALAQQEPPAATIQAVAPKKYVKRRARTARAPAARVASYDAFAFRPFFSSGW